MLYSHHECTLSEYSNFNKKKSINEVDIEVIMKREKSKSIEKYEFV